MQLNSHKVWLDLKYAEGKLGFYFIDNGDENCRVRYDVFDSEGNWVCYIQDLQKLLKFIGGANT